MTINGFIKCGQRSERASEHMLLAGGVGGWQSLQPSTLHPSTNLHSINLNLNQIIGEHKFNISQIMNISYTITTTNHRQPTNCSQQRTAAKQSLLLAYKCSN